MYDNVPQSTTMYDKNYFLTTVFLSQPKVLHGKLFEKFAALSTKALDSRRTTARTHDNPRKTTFFEFVAPCRTLKSYVGDQHYDSIFVAPKSLT